jgi:hypothetical protein
MTSAIGPSIQAQAAECAVRLATVSVSQQQVEAMQLGIPVERALLEPEGQRPGGARLQVFGALHGRVTFQVLHLDPAPEPLLAPVEGNLWRVMLATTDLKYGGCGTPQPDARDNWRIPVHAAVVLAPRIDDLAYLGEFKWTR